MSSHVGPKSAQSIALVEPLYSRGVPDMHWGVGWGLCEALGMAHVVCGCAVVFTSIGIPRCRFDIEMAV